MEAIYRALFYIAAGYLFGSVLFARLFGRLFRHTDITKSSRDQNPGTANAFLYGGFWCGVLTLIGDMAKGFLPVFLYLRLSFAAKLPILGALVIAAPVIGHIFPVFFGFHGGKGIATSFGVLLGLLPDVQPLAILAIAFLFFSAVLRITPHIYRTELTYLCAFVLMLIGGVSLDILIGFTVITAVVLVRLARSHEEREKIKVRLLWMR